MRRTISVLAAIAILGATGFFVYRWWRNRTQLVTFQMTYKTHLWPPVPGRFLIDGRPLAEMGSPELFSKTAPEIPETFTQENRVAMLSMLAMAPEMAESWLPPAYGASREVELPVALRRVNSSGERPRITGQVLTPCGWKEKTVSLDWSAGGPQANGGKGQKLMVAARMASVGVPVRHVEFFVDNRLGGEARLELGQSAAVVAANASTKVELLAPDCAEGNTLKLNGQPIGTIPLELAARKNDLYGSVLHIENMPQPPSWTYLIDTSGKRCYQLTEKEYEKAGGLGFGVGSDAPTYTGKVLHRLAPVKIHYFLQRAPNQVREKAFPGFEPDITHRGQLVEVSCG